MPVLLQYYSGVVWSTDQDANATEEMFCTVEVHTTCAGPHEEAPGLVRKQREHMENSGESIYCGFRRGMGHIGGASRLRRLVRIISVGSGAVLSCLEPALR